MKYILLLAALILTGCKEMPASYRGNFVDTKTGAALTLKKSKGILTLPDGTTLKTKTLPLTFEKVLKGEAGIYVDVSKSSRAQLNWIIPDVNTRQEDGGIVWFSSTVIFSDMNLGIEGKAKSVALLVCTNGQVILDTESQTFQVGCGSDALDLVLQRK